MTRASNIEGEHSSSSWSSPSRMHNSHSYNLVTDLKRPAPQQQQRHDPYYPRDDRDVLHAALLLRAALHGAYVPHILARLLAEYTPRVRAIADTSLTRSERNFTCQRFVLSRLPHGLPAHPPPVWRLELRFWTGRHGLHVSHADMPCGDADAAELESELELGLGDGRAWADAEDVGRQLEDADAADSAFFTGMRCRFAIARKPRDERMSGLRLSSLTDEGLYVYACDWAWQDFRFADYFDVGCDGDEEESKECFGPFLESFGPGDVLVLNASCRHALSETLVQGVDASLYLRARVDFERMVVVD